MSKSERNPKPGVCRARLLSDFGSRPSFGLRISVFGLIIDGCPLECGANVLRNAGFTNFKQLKVHELSVRKNDSSAVDEAAVARLAEAALRVLRESA